MTNKTKHIVAVVMGSKSDWPVMEHTVNTLLEFGIVPEVRVISAHRTPEEATAFASTAATHGIKVIIAAAGMAAHLAGVLAAHTILPVLSVPQKGGALDGLDALLAMVQMPKGVPVGTLALGRSGAINAALMAVQILALSDANLRKKFQKYKRDIKKQVLEADREIQMEAEKKI